MHRATFAFASAVVTAGLLAPTALRADIRYTITDLGTLGGNTSSAAAINNLGQVVGQANINASTYHAFLFSNGTMTDLGTLSGTNSLAGDINDIGEIVGSSRITGGPVGLQDHAFYYHAGTMTDLGTFGGYNSGANAINNSGQIVGSAQTGQYIDVVNHFTENAFVYSNGAKSNLGTFGETDTNAFAINNSGQVLGNVYNTTTGYTGSFLLNPDNSVTKLNNVAGADLNDLGQVVGSSSGGAFLLSNGTMTYIGALNPAVNDNLHRTYAFAINNGGQIVGRSPISTSTNHAYLYTTAGGMLDLNSLIDPASGWTLTSASDINNSGLIVGQGTNSAGQSHAFLLTPTPEPASLSLLALGATTLFPRRRRR